MIGSRFPFQKPNRHPSSCDCSRCMEQARRTQQVTLPDLARVDREADTIPPGKEPAGWAEWGELYGLFLSLPSDTRAVALRVIRALALEAK